jgi:pimeloyl-ACP methyl ester carboxylesterase
MNHLTALRRAAVFFVAFLIVGCAGLPDVQIRHVDSRPLELVVRAGTGPIVVFENGLGARIEWWGKVLPTLPADTPYFAYNRPGIGKSAPVDTPRDGEHIVEELRRTLQQQSMQPPYVLVGHSLGGLYMQLFARKYPEEVGALVLVDSTHPKQLEGAGAIENQSLVVRGLVKVLISGVAQQELDTLTQTGLQVLSLPTVERFPVYVISASDPMKETSKLAQLYNAMRQDIARMYPTSSQVWVESGHAIPIEKPEAVVTAIRAALSDIRAKQ